ncbi:unnamed protein product [marine sediment metagenome]|uniref:ParB/Sulfiredoxin domain-containing protein n=1 Tax=marine sediment metagenome TaxID=412755 RepID=X1S3H9_9ZZZZ
MKTTIETIDKERAQEYIAKIDGNRPLSNGYVGWLIGRQRRGEWQTNGDSIKFDKNGVLRDGQHRLMMVMQTGMPIEVVVVREIDPVAFITMDTGKNRNLADVLAINKYQNSKLLASALGWVRRYLVNRMYPTGGRTSHEQHLAVLDKHPELQESVRFYIDLGNPTGSPGYRPITPAIHYLFSRIDPPVYECADCHTKFTVPQEDFDEVACPSCGRKWAIEELAKLRKKIKRSRGLEPPTP